MFVKSNDAQIYYDVLGAGKDVVLLHAFPLSSDLWKPVADQLALRYRVTLIDLRGHGRSETGNGVATMAKHAEDVIRVCKQAEIGRACFAGVSIGGYVLFELWRQHREKVAGLALCDTKAGPDSPEARSARMKSADDIMERGAAQFLDSLIPKVLGESTRRNRQDIVQSIRKMMDNSPVQGIAAAQRGMAERPDSTPTLSTINSPTQILCGDEDTATPLAESQFMQSHIKGSRLQVIPQAGHLSVYEKTQDAVRILRGFFDRL
jgi:3-oxoadipate enol-lactonase